MIEYLKNYLFDLYLNYKHSITYIFVFGCVLLIKTVKSIFLKEFIYIIETAISKVFYFQRCYFNILF